MKQRSLENQYRMLDALIARFDAVEVPVRLSGWGRAQELAALATELTEGAAKGPSNLEGAENSATRTAVFPHRGRSAAPDTASPSASPVVQTQLFEEAA